MEKITTGEDLKMAIQQLEDKQNGEWLLLKEQFLITYENLKPLNIIKNTIKDVTASADFKESVIGTTMGLTAGFLSKKLVVGASNNPIKKIAGALLQYGVSAVVARNPETIKLADVIIKLISKKKTHQE